MAKIKDKPKEKASTTGAPAKKSNKDTSNKPDHGVLMNWLEFADQINKPKQWEWFVIDQFIRGNHNITGNPLDNTLEIDTTDYIAYPINKMYANLRAVRSFVTRHQPKIEVEPIDRSEEAVTNARRMNAILDRDNRLNNHRRLNKEWVYYGVKYGVGYRQVGFDKEKRKAIRWTVDPFDLLIGSKTGTFEDAPFVIKPIVRTIAYWRNKYPESNVTPDNEVSASEYKKLSIEIEQQTTEFSTTREEEQTAIGYECWYRLYEENELGGTINKVLFTASDIIDFQETPYNEFPFVPYYSDVAPNEQYPEGHMKHIIAPQRMLNLLNKQLLEYNYVVNRGRYQFSKGSGFEVVNAEEGQLIRHNPGKPITPVPPPPINPSLQWQIGYADQAIQDIGSQNDASQGQAPFAGASGDLVEALQTADSNSILELRENFEDALALEAQLILQMYELFEDKGIVIRDETSKDEIDEFVAFGDKAIERTGRDLVKSKKDENKVFYTEDGSYHNYVRVTSENQVKVSVTSELGETKSARLNLLLRLREIGEIPPGFITRFLEFPNTDEMEREIMEELAVELQKQRTEQAIQAETQPQPNIPTNEQTG